jgi:flagellar assembly protein FliH
MSSRARRVPVGLSAEPFHWPEVDAPAPADPGSVGQAGVRTAAAEGPAADPARLAALERDAFVKGYAEGERAGLEAGSTRAEAMLRRLAGTLDELGGLRAAMLRHAERQVVALALTIARRILRREVSLDHDFVLAMVRVALDKFEQGTPATIRLHPDDLLRVGQALTDGTAGSNVRVVPDGALSRGGCIVESDIGFIDASLDTQFDQVAQALAMESGEALSVAGDREHA